MLAELSEKFADFSEGHLRIDCSEFPEQFAIIDCDISEVMSRNYLIVGNVLAKNPEIKPADILDRYFVIELDIDDTKRFFGGYCAKVSYLDQNSSMILMRIELRPKQFHLEHRVDTRLFVDSIPMDVARQVLSDAGVEDYLDETSSDETSDAAELIVQYNETDFSFLSRLLEGEGRYFYYRHESDRSILIMCNNAESHEEVPGHPVIKYQLGHTVSRQSGACIYDWDEQTSKQTTVFSTTDYDFTKINADIRTSVPVSYPMGLEAESYTYPGGYTEIPEGERILALSTAAADADQFRVTAKTNVLDFGIGRTFFIDGKPASEGTPFLVTATNIRLEGGTREEVEQGSCNPFTCSFEAIPAERDYRPLKPTPRPVIPGVQTAEVVGPSGSEIYTDEYGRVKVHFHWDRHGSKDENSSCWIRVATPWAGRNWGSITVPRIGQEVVVQFENGDPDRPIITGMLWNQKNMPPDGLPAAASRMGMRSNSTPGGGGASEFMMEDKKDQEMVTMIAERDYEQTIKNDAYINVGYEKTSPGSYTMNVYMDRVEQVSNGDYNLLVGTGNRNTYVKTDDALAVDGNRSEVVQNTLGFEAKDITLNGKSTYKVESPDVNINGKSKTTIGSAAIEVDGKTVKISGKSEILLSVGGSSIKLDAMGVTIAGPLVKIN